MKEISLTADNRQIKINGQVYDLLLSEQEIIKRATVLIKKAERLNEKKPKEVMEALNEPYALLDAMLGPGAARRISGGKPVGFGRALSWVTVIAKAAGEAYAEEIAHE